MEEKKKSCRNCINWNTTHESTPQGWGLCEEHSHDYVGKHEGLITKDLSAGDRANVYTAPDFGCTQWQAKEQD
jgi:hypothetical protein